MGPDDAQYSFRRGPFDPDATDAKGITGWWDVQGFDATSILIDILANKDAAANAAANAQYAQQLAANAQVIADGEIISYYNVEDASAGFANNTAYSTASYGDIWINISGYNQLANGALHANAIFRYQNSAGGSSRPSATTPTDLRWYHASNNAVGKIYLDAWKSQNTADAKIVTYVLPGTPLGVVPATYGPDPSTTPSGHHNPNPEGDIWIDTQDNFRMYRYQVIGTDVTTNTAYQTPNTTHSGWADARDARLGDFPFSESRKAYIPMNEWSIEDMGSGEEIVLYDYSGNRNHARQNSTSFLGTSYDFVDTTIKSISTKALDRVNTAILDSPRYKDIALLHHDSIRTANQQSYSMWFKPSGAEQKHDYRIISRDQSAYWALNIGGNASSTYGGSESIYDGFSPADGSYVNVMVKGAVTYTPGGAGIGTGGPGGSGIFITMY